MYRLMIVDDEPIIRRGIRSLASLPEIGISELLEAGGGAEALRLMKESPADIVMLDINMPDMDGLSLAALLKEGWPDCRLIMVTGYDYFEYTQSAIRTGVDDYLLKPVSRAEIEMVLKRVMEKAARRHSEKKLEELEARQEGSAFSESGDQKLSPFSGLSSYLREHLFDPDLSLTKAAQELGFNKSYLSEIIRQLYGVPFQDYVGRKRMERAKLLLLSTEMKNQEIAEALGYDDVNYFITKFKKSYRITPKQYRRGVREHEI